MTLESDLIRRYRGAFTQDECNTLISQIEYLNQNNLKWAPKISEKMYQFLLTL